MTRTFIAAALSLAMLVAAAPSAVAQSQQPAVSREVSRTTVGPWAVIGWVAPNGTGYCSAERKVDKVTFAFVRVPQGYALVIHSPDWQLQAGTLYQVQFVVAAVTNGANTAQVLNATTILVPFTQDQAMMRRVAGAPELKVTAAETAITVPLDQFGEALTALDDCMAQRSGGSGPQLQPSQAPGPRLRPVQAPPAPPSLPANVPTSKMSITNLADAERR